MKPSMNANLIFQTWTEFPLTNVLVKLIIIESALKQSLNLYADSNLNISLLKNLCEIVWAANHPTGRVRGTSFHRNCANKSKRNDPSSKRNKKYYRKYLHNDHGQSWIDKIPREIRLTPRRPGKRIFALADFVPSRYYVVGLFIAAVGFIWKRLCVRFWRIIKVIGCVNSVAPRPCGSSLSPYFIFSGRFNTSQCF